MGTPCRVFSPLTATGHYSILVVFCILLCNARQSWLFSGLCGSTCCTVMKCLYGSTSIALLNYHKSIVVKSHFMLYFAE